MSNSAIVQFGLDPDTAPAVYLHWHGDPATVQALLDVAKRVSVRDYDPAYAAARFVQIAANTIGGTTGIGIGPIDQMPCYLDHGVYIVKRLDVIDRLHAELSWWGLNCRPTLDDPEFDPATYESQYRAAWSINRTRFREPVA